MSRQLRKAMPAVCRFYAISPTEFWALRIQDFAELARFMRDTSTQRKPRRR